MSGCRKQRHIKIKERIEIRKIIIVTCGDGAEEAVKFLKEKFGYSAKYFITTAGASKTFTSIGCKENEAKFYVEKKKAAMFDLEIYMGDAEEVLIILIDHNWCAAWHEFLNEKKERIRHIESLRSAKKIIESELKKKKDIKPKLSIKLFYIERDNRKKITNIEEVKPY